MHEDIQRDEFLRATAAVMCADLLDAWRKTTDSPTAKYPCENFKAGFVMARMGAICSEQEVRMICRSI